MGNLILFSSIAVTALYSLGRPWLGIIAYYLLAILGPQYIWWWNFQGLRVSFYVAVFTIAGIVISKVTGRLQDDFIKSKVNFWILLLWIFVAMSYFFGPYVDQFDVKYGLSPSYLFTNTNNIFLFYLLGTLVINDTKKLRYLSWVMVVSTIYLIYWANYQYFTASWDHFSFGRLKGPESASGASIYGDENAFAMLFVTGIPFIYYLGTMWDKEWLRYGSWAIVVMGWHAVFLTGSRGGLLGLGVTLLMIVLQSSKKYLALFLIPAFCIFFTLQAGSTMKQRSETIDDKEERSSEMRITAWKGGLKMIAAHPVNGVGLGSFITALPHYIDTNPRVAHNTLIQYAAESGIGAGVCYVMVILTFFRNWMRVKRWCNEQKEDADVKWLRYFNGSSSASFTGLIVCSLFLTLNNYEIFFFLLLVSNTLAKLLPAPEYQQEVQLGYTYGN